MTDYGKIVARILYSENSDFSSPLIDTGMLSDTVSSEESLYIPRINVSTSGTTIDLSNFTTIQGIFIQNLDPTNFVDISWRCKLASKTWAVDKLTFTDAGAYDTIDDADGTFLSVLHLVEGDYVRITGCTEEAGNNLTAFVAAVSDVQIISSTSLTSTAGTEAGAVTMQVLAANRQRVCTNGIFVIGGCNLDPASTFTITADTAACECSIIVIGT
jgi:hypothetical protein